MLTAIGDVLRECYARGWITTRDGNISLRMSLEGQISPHMHITPKGVRKNTIHPEHIIKVNIDSSAAATDVSTEFHMHRNLLIDAKSTRCVVHVHPTYTIAAMQAGIDIQEASKDFPELKRYTRVGSMVPTCDAGSLRLAELTSSHLRGGISAGDDVKGLKEIIYDIVGQKGHGVCAVAKHPWAAFEHIERLEHICKILLLSQGRGLTAAHL
jgi:ribulose-5-phosphate 4-epimerase/fuculose-1-phosphate aldolase